MLNIEKLLFTGLLQKVASNYRSDIVGYETTGEIHRKRPKDKFYLKSAALEKAWGLHRQKLIDTAQLFQTVSILVSPTIENMQYTIVELFTGDYEFYIE